MSVRRVGKRLRKTQDEINQNARRLAETNVLPQRVVNPLNKIHRYVHTFSMEAGRTAFLNMRILEFPILCTVNPPTIDISCSSRFDGDNPGEFVESTFVSTQVLFPDIDGVPVNDFKFGATGIIVPLDGCYSFTWSSPAWGASYFLEETVSIGFLHNGFQWRLIQQTKNGFVSILGPPVAIYTPASPVYGVVECAAGDTLSCFLTQMDISDNFPWVAGSVLHGFFLDSGTSFGASTEIKLVAVAEG